MADENPIGVLGSLTTRVLGVLVALIDELAEAGAIDRTRLLRKLEDFELANPGDIETPAERRMGDTVMRLVRSVLEKKNG